MSQSVAFSHIPDDAQKMIKGSYYKIGARGKVYIFINSQWSTSGISEKQFDQAAKTLSPNNRENGGY